MKTGFICASGFNLVATATHGNRRLIAIVLGARSSAVRTEKVLQLFEKGFAGSSLSWLMPALGTVDTLRPVDAAPPNLREEVCGPNRHRPEAETADEEPSPTGDPDRAAAFALLPDFRAKGAKPVLGPPVPSMPPAVVFVGPPKKPGNPEAALAKSSEPRPAPHKPKAAKPALASTKSTAAPQQQPSHRRKPAAPASAAAPTAAPAATPAAAPPAAAPAATPPSTSLFSPTPTIAPAAASPRQ
jgi:D-alanyl-D-alanine carboxypeptidase